MSSVEAFALQQDQIIAGKECNLPKHNQENTVLINQNGIDENVVCNDVVDCYDVSAASTQWNDTNATPVQQFSCLYTRQKSQKRKIWQDGRLVIRGSCAVLHSANPNPGSGDLPLDQCDLSRSEIDAIHKGCQESLEMEKFLVNVEGIWNSKKTQTVSNCAQSVSVISSGMQKVMTRKFQKPSTVLPPDPHLKQNQTVLGKRRRPLQPGELVRRYYPASQVAPPITANNGQLCGGSLQPTNVNKWNHTPLQTPILQDQHSGNGFQPIPPQNQPMLGSNGIDQGDRSFASPCFFSDKSPSCNDSAVSRIEREGNQERHIPITEQHSFIVNSMLPGRNRSVISGNINSGGGCAPTMKQQQSGMNSRIGKNLTNAFLGNAFNPSAYYGNESDEASEEEGDKEPDTFQLSMSQTQDSSTCPIYDRHASIHATQSRTGICNSKSQETFQQASPSVGISTLSAEQLLGIFAVGPSSCTTASISTLNRKNQAEDIGKDCDSHDVFTLPEIGESSDDDD